MTQHPTPIPPYHSLLSFSFFHILLIFYQVQDQLLLSWLQSNPSKSILSWVLGAVHSYQVWDQTHIYFSLKWWLVPDSCTVTIAPNPWKQKFLGHIKYIVDEFIGIGCLVTPGKHFDAILEGFPLDYAAVIVVIESKFEILPIIEVEAVSLRGLNLWIKLWVVYSTKPSMVLNRLWKNGFTRIKPPFWSLAFLLWKSILLFVYYHAS